MRALCILLVVWLAACGTHPPNVRCDRRLQPINTGARGAPAAAAPVAAPAGRQP
jgi:hypothetical protein